MRRPSLLLPRATVAVLLLAGAALAQPSEADKITATALFKEGRALMEARRFPEACAKLEESQRLDPGGGTLLNLAICHEQEGKTATAWSEMTEALGVARRDGRAERVKLAEEHIAALEARLSRLRIVVPPASLVAELEVKRDGVVVRPGAWGTGIPVDPGEHRVTAKAPGKRPFERVLTMSSCGRPMTITIPLLADDPTARSVSATPSAAASPGGTEPQTKTVTNGTRTALIVSGLVLTAAGVGIGAGYGAASLSSKNASAPYCREDNTCVEPGTTYRADALRYGDLATVGLVTASVFAVATIVVVVMVPSTKTVTAQNLMRGTIQF